MAIEFDWDDSKCISNLRKHAVDFERVLDFVWDSAIIGVDARREYHEVRYVAFGLIGTRLHVCVYVQRGDVRRIISLRKANDREEQFYESQIIDLDIEAETTDNKRR